MSQFVTVSVVDLVGKRTYLTVPLDYTVEMLKKGLQDVNGIPVDQQRLIFAGKQMEDGRELYDYGIGEGSTIHQVLRLAGK